MIAGKHQAFLSRKDQTSKDLQQITPVPDQHQSHETGDNKHDKQQNKHVSAAVDISPAWAASWSPGKPNKPWQWRRVDATLGGSKKQRFRRGQTPGQGPGETSTAAGQAPAAKQSPAAASSCVPSHVKEIMLVLFKGFVIFVFHFWAFLGACLSVHQIRGSIERSIELVEVMPVSVARRHRRQNIGVVLQAASLSLSIFVLYASGRKGLNLRL